MKATSPLTKYLWAWIDPTMACNLSCKLCYTKDLHSQNHMSKETFNLIIDSLMEENIVVQKLHLNWNGEPTMNPNFIEIIEILENKRIYFPWEFHTNGMLINYDYAIKLVKAVKTGSIFVSIDGGNAFSHDFNRGEGTFQKSILGLRNLLLAKKNLGYGPKISVFQIDLKVPENQYDPEFLELLKDVTEWVRVQPFHPKNGAQFDVNVMKLNQSNYPNSSKVLQIPSNRWWLYQTPDTSFLPSHSCFWAGNALFFNTNGDVKVCLLSRHEAGLLGNIYAENIQQIINKAETFREQINTIGRQNYKHCHGCKFLEGEPKVEIENNLIDTNYE